jgi:hypothetical protein
MVDSGFGTPGAGGGQYQPAAAPQSVPTPTPAESWTMVASTGDLFLGQSNLAYAVYSSTVTHGRWPLTPEGYNYAYQTYEAHRQSLAHGLAYTATGYQDPARLGLPTEPVIKSKSYAAPLSYVGSTRRIIAWAGGVERRNPAMQTVTWVAAILALLVVWAFLLVWYAIIFGLFGVFVIPYRLVRRSQRKNTHVQQTTLATQQAMLQQMQAQQQALAQQIRVQQPAQYPQQLQYPQQPVHYPQSGVLPPNAPPAIGQYPPQQ